MQKIALLFTLVILAACNSSNDTGAKEVALAPSKHSALFNQSVQAMMQNYYDLTEAFVNWDSAALPAIAIKIDSNLSHLPLSEVKADSALVASNLVAAMTDLNAIRNPSLPLTTRRHALNSLTDHLYAFLNTAQYDRQKLYLQNCPMAFNDEEPGVWLSPSDSIRNPYLGLHHPRYKSGMLECGETKEVLNYTGAK